MLRTDNRGVARAFAERRAATNSNGQFFSPDGNVIYSYGPHWPLAAWVNSGLHINDDRYSTTTSKHRSFVISALVRECPGWLDKAQHHQVAVEFKRFLKACGVEE